MRDDILIITEKHRKAAREVFNILLPQISKHTGKYILTIGGESGAGKSETASALAFLLEHQQIPTYIVQQDDFFVYPPLTNARKRKEDLSWVGPGEVHIDLINSTINAIRFGIDPVIKPLVIFSEDRITIEKVSFIPYKVIILEGTYTTLAENVNCRIFIDRDMDDTRIDRLKRSRENQDDFLEKILLIEHEIIKTHKEKAEIIINRDFSASLSG